MVFSGFLTSFLQMFGFTLITFLCWEYFLKKINFKSLTKKMPTIYGLPILGISYKFIPTKKLLYEIENCFETLKCSTFFTWLGVNPFVITIDPDVVKMVLTSDEFLTKARSLYGSIENALPNGLMTSYGHKWKHDRRLMNFSFSNQSIKSLMPNFNKGTQRIIDELDLMVDGEEHDIFGVIKRKVFQTSIETTMGTELKDGNKTDEQVANGFNFILHKVACESVLNTVCLGFLVRTPKFNQTIKFLRDYAANLINNKYASIQTATESLETEDTEKENNGIFLEQAMSYYKRGLFEFSDVISETHTIIAGTFDTVTTTIYSLIVLLAMHPDVQEKLFKEISNAIPIDDKDISYEDTTLVPYMDMVINETLRLMPSIPIIGREINTDFKINEDITLPRKMQVMIPIFTLHRHKDIWGPNANDFDPDNFLPEKVSSRHPFAFIPFSKGYRACLGLRYARVAVRVQLLMLVKKFKFSTSFKYEDLVFVDYISLRYDVEPKIKIERRIA